MNTRVKAVNPGSPIAKSKIEQGDVLRRINSAVINDILDYQYHSYDSQLLLEFIDLNEKIKFIKLSKEEGADLGIEFETYLIDKEHHCANKCIFCFIDQLPKGMRNSLYYKDDDVRLSFLQGNYVTLTNLSLKDIERIIKLRISPINVSVHTLDPKLRSFMLGGKLGGAGIAALKALARAGIALNCQIVCCPGINDGRELSKTIEGFIEMGECIKSVSIVPVGLTKHRQGLMKLQPFDKALALQTIQQVEQYGEKCLKERGTRVFYCADEMYMLAGLELPPNEFYEDYPQLENGVGMMRLFITEFEEALQKGHDGLSPLTSTGCSIATGTLASKYLANLIDTAVKKYDTIRCGVYAVRNDYFGENVTVSGLITCRDIAVQLSGKQLGKKLLIPQNMLRSGEEVFLDDISVSELSIMLGVPIRVVKQNGEDLLLALMEQ